MIRVAYIILILTLITSCQSKKKQAELLEMSKPTWLKSRPVSNNYFYGIGISSKVGGEQYYQNRSKEKALADLAQQISTRIKSETNLIKTEDNKGVYEYIQSRINATSNEFLEGYEFVDSWEDLSTYYTFYQLSKQDFYTLKAERKNKAIEFAWLKINQAQEQKAQMNLIQSLQLYASAIDALSGYLNEETSKTVNDEKIDLFETSRSSILNIIKQLNVSCSKKEIIGKTGTTIPSDKATIEVLWSNRKAEGIPVKFIYSAGYIINEIQVTDAKGNVSTPALNFNQKEKEQLVAEIDFVSLGRKVSKNLLVRQLIEKQKKQSCLTDIYFR
ncbi:LPP20 family lipoprotein [Carboxylicivirga linearis]|uniref:LPP20 family lipoprotein n=1 Tax=Carboxylicivirga linearis TaxID=1628157 RepID=A0ABS5K0C2_9BACT|nr:LPP20 family lipoprotein [Carboxylicivirga linearis]MBS2100607.1 LPP20 family lipoprotein [Carboxylicivirga linearis]